MSSTPRVLIVEERDPPAPIVPISTPEPGAALEWVRVPDLQAAVEQIAASPPEAVLLDLEIGGATGISAFAQLYAIAPDVPIVVFGPSPLEGLLIRAVRQGACDYFLSDQLHPTLVTRTIRHAVERKRSARERSASEARYREIFERSSDAIALATAEGEILDVNPAFYRLTSRSPEELERLTALDFCENPREGLRIARELRRTGSVQQMEVRVRLGSGEVKDCLVSVSTRQAAERGYLCTLHDITQRKEAEAALRQTQEQFWLAQKMEAVGRLAGGLAHDFNNLLGVIGGSAELMLLDLAEGTVDAEDIRQILRASDHAASLTRQLLAFGRKQVLQPQTLDLNGLITESASMLQRVIREDIVLDTRLDPELAAVEADPSQVHQVLMNLALNASDAMPMGGRLTIETTNAELTPEDARRFPYTVVPGRYVVLEMTDTGSGMADDTKEHLFEPFFTTKPPGVGTGLGLATVYGIVKQSGGYIWVESEPQQGTTFRIYLPRGDRPASAMPVSAVRSAPSAIGGETVLLVEDEDAMRSVIARTLTRAGYQVIEAADGEEALRVAERGCGGFDVLLTDVIMPGVSGHRLGQRLRARCPDLPVLYMSGHPYQEIARHGVLEPGMHLIEKPFRPDVLLQALRNVLDPSAEPISAQLSRS
jgi:two-component system cell cycle sensor histidine kinase/response regulator CckA